MTFTLSTPSSRMFEIVLAGSLAFALSAGGAPARAQTFEEDKAAGDALFNGDFIVDDVDPEAHVPSAEARSQNPVAFASFLFQLGDKADAAKNRGDNAMVVKLYRALAAAVPEATASYRELCKAYQAVGDLAKAERSCEVALTKRGVTPADFQSYVQLVVSMPGALRPAQVEKLNTIVQHLKTKPSTEAIARELESQIAKRPVDGYEPAASERRPTTADTTQSPLLARVKRLSEMGAKQLAIIAVSTLVVLIAGLFLTRRKARDASNDEVA